MAAPPLPAATISGAVSLLERAVGYTRGSLHLVRPELMSAPTPCTRWNLRALLVHMYDSLTAMCEAADLGRVDLGADLRGVDLRDADPTAAGPVGLPIVAALQDKACALLGAWLRPSHALLVVGGDAIVAGPTVAAAGALEIAVHGWDVARACGIDRPIPEALAAELLMVATILVTDADRGMRFAAPVGVDPTELPSAGSLPADPRPADREHSDRLVRFLGRHPR